MYPSWEVFEHLCEEHGVKPTKVFADLNMSVANATNWKTGKSFPKLDKVKLIADYFGMEGIDGFYDV